MARRIVWGSAGIVAGTLVVLPLLVLTLLGVVLPSLFNITLPDNPARITVPLSWGITIIAALLIYQWEQRQQQLLSARAVVLGAILALIPVILLMLFVLAIYFMNGIPQQRPYVNDPRDVPPFGWQGGSLLLFQIAFIGWPLSAFVLVPTALLLLGTTIANWRTLPHTEKRWSIALLIAAALMALTWPVWGAVGTWLAD
jgi:hypothetical protein